VFLIEHGARLDVVNHTGLAPLHVAARFTQSTISFTNIQNNYKITKWIFRRGQLEIVARLSSYAPFTLHTADVCGRTPLHIASLYGQTQVVKLLLRNGAGISQ
jgi:ankyrin repeat protein